VLSLSKHELVSVAVGGDRGDAAGRRAAGVWGGGFRVQSWSVVVEVEVVVEVVVEVSVEIEVSTHRSSRA
jgi:hypothetical protein